MTSPEETRIAIFRQKEIRKVVYKNEWWFSVVDVVGALTDSNKPRVYWNAMKTRVKQHDGFELSTICRQLKLKSNDGKYYLTDCSNTEGVFRIIQSRHFEAREKLEKAINKPIVSSKRYLDSLDR